MEALAAPEVVVPITPGPAPEAGETGRGRQ
jgi:hypothetical protein